MKYYTYDLEVFPNIFLFAGKFSDSSDYQMFEISDRVNQLKELYSWCTYLRDSKQEMVGFNNLAYDYFFIHELLTNPHTFTLQKTAEINSKIFQSQRSRGLQQFYVNERLVPQIDILKFMHFDNDAKRTSLKSLQFAMRAESVEDLPFEIRALNDQEKDILRSYNLHDILETEKFFFKNIHMIEMRREFLADGSLKGDVLNFSDVKIGTEYLVNRIGKQKCFNGSKPKQTFRTVINYDRIILDKIQFRTIMFNEILDWFLNQKIVITSNERPSLEAKLCGLDFHFGVGGVHASADNKIFYSNEEYRIIDVDVTGMYPAVALANNFAPEHLKEYFSIAYRQVGIDRSKYKKGSPKNLALKLASNGVYGNSNNPFSCFYDPQYTFSVTINGQLQILQLVEMIYLLPDTELIQANTDGITIRIKKTMIPLFDMWCKVWEEMTGLFLEHVEYKRMWIKDVNNYISEKMNGDLKRKGAYWYPITEKDYDGVWHKDFSNLASIKAAELAMINSWPVEAAIKLVTNKFDFMLRYKATGESKIFIGDEKQLKTVRYFVSTKGRPMKKVSPPKGEVGQYKRKNSLKDDYFNSVMKEIGKDVWDARVHTSNKSKYGIVETSIQSGKLVQQCNHVKDFKWENIDWDYYINEAKKIIIGS